MTDFQMPDPLTVLNLAFPEINTPWPCQHSWPSVCFHPLDGPEPRRPVTW